MGTLRANRKTGLSLVELVLVTSILGMLAGTLVEASTSMGRMTSLGGLQAVMQERGEKALSTIIDDLSRSGYKAVNGKEFPYVFDTGQAFGDFVAHTHTPPAMESGPGDSDFGPLREIVFVQPADYDRDGRPDMDLDRNGVPELDGDGNGTRTEDPGDLAGVWEPGQGTIDAETGVLWSHDEISYVVVTRPDGVNYLERRVNGNPATARRIASHVERVQFDTPTTSGWGIPLRSVHVRIYFRDRENAGGLLLYQSEVVLSLRNN